MLALSLSLCILGLTAATPVELEKRMTIGRLPILGWDNLPGAIACNTQAIYDTKEVHAAATSNPASCWNKSDGYTYCSYTLQPVVVDYNSYMIARRRTGARGKVTFMTAETGPARLGCGWRGQAHPASGRTSCLSFFVQDLLTGPAMRMGQAVLMVIKLE